MLCQKIFSVPRVVPCFPLLGLTPSGLFMGLSSTIIYTSELILCSTISKSTYPSIFYYKYSLPVLKLGFISNLSHFPSLHVVESVTSSSSKLVGFSFET